MIELVLGGSRSGKSGYAQQQALQSQKQVVFIATAQPTDREMSERIARHKAERPKTWILVEQHSELHLAIEHYGSDPDRIVLVDCLTLWLNNEMYLNQDAVFDDLADSLTKALSTSRSDLILVSNEVGMGIVPLGAVSRKFADWQGWLNQRIASCADRVTFVAAGLPLVLKDTCYE